jgi:hypothetical protein
MEEAGRKIGRKLGDAEKRVHDELQQVIDYLDNEVVPAVRDHSTRGLRVAAEKLTKLAEYIEQQRRQKP